MWWVTISVLVLCIWKICKNYVLTVDLSIPEAWCLGQLWLLLSKETSSEGLESLWHSSPWWGGCHLKKPFEKLSAHFEGKVWVQNSWSLLGIFLSISLSQSLLELYVGCSLPYPCKSPVWTRLLYGVKFLVLGKPIYLILPAPWLLWMGHIHLTTLVWLVYSFSAVLQPGGV